MESNVWQVVDCFWSIRSLVGTIRTPIFPLPEGVSRRSLGVKMDTRLRVRNFLDQFVFGCQFLRQTLTPPNMPAPTIFQRVLARERVGAVPPGFIHEGNLLDPHWHGMPKVIIMVLLCSMIIMTIFVLAV